MQHRKSGTRASVGLKNKKQLVTNQSLPKGQHKSKPTLIQQRAGSLFIQLYTTQTPDLVGHYPSTVAVADKP